jgi:hypothetical protein
MNRHFLTRISRQPQLALKMKGRNNTSAICFVTFLLLSISAFSVRAREVANQNNWSLETSITFPPAAQI